MNGARVVVACRLPTALRLTDRPADVVRMFESLISRATPLEGVVVATGYDLVALAWEEARLEEAVTFATDAIRPLSDDDPAWACGMAAGDLFTAADAGLVPASAAHPVAWGEPLALASALARLAKPNEVLADLSVPAVVSRELLTNRARVGQFGGKRIRGFRVEARKPWRAVAAADIARMVDPPLLGRDDELARLMAASNVIILRADSGFGGSRLLAEVAANTRPSRSITLTPFSGMHEPLGAVRRALTHVAATERITLPPNLHPVLDKLLGAHGISVDEAALLMAHQLRAQKGSPLPSLLLDDVTDLDEVSIEACARAIGLLDGAIRVVARVDTMSQLPRSLARFSDGEEVALGRFDAELAQALAGACTSEALAEGARVQWARRGGGSPLGIIEAVAAGLAKGELIWTGDTLSPLKRTGGDDIARPVGYWMARRAEDLRASTREVLVALAHLGGESSVSELYDVVQAVAPHVELTQELVILRRSRWIRELRPGTFGLVARGQREAILEFSRNEQTLAWRLAVAKMIEAAPGTLRRAEAAQHAARAGRGDWASRLAMSAARTASLNGLEEAASALAGFAAMQDPLRADLDLGALPIEDLEEVSADDATVAAGPLDLEPLDELIEVTSEPPPPPPARGVSEERISRVSYQGLIDGARDLKETRWAELARKRLVDTADDASKRRGLLALARAYADEGRVAEALVHGLDALARMREFDDVTGARTCLLFLARIYERTDRPAEAGSLKSAAEAVS